jgi:dephospho-CoA kinase
MLPRASTAYRIGLTGGIACGKTTVANQFAALGVPVVDTDLLAREVVAPGSPLLAQVAAHFGAAVLSPDGSLDRRELRTRVFAQPAERLWLEQLTHPAIRALTDERSAAAGGPYVIVAIPLLVETGAASRFDRVLVVDCEPEVQLARLTARDGSTRDEALAMLAAQAPRAARLAIANDIIQNNGDIAHLRDQVEKLHRQYVTAARMQSETVQSDRAAT